MRFTCWLSFALAVLPAMAPAHEIAPENAPPARVLYLFAHQDDEVFILARMARDVARGSEVHAVWITDGGRRGSGQRREAESRAVMRRIGVAEDRLAFLGFPDQHAIEHLSAIWERVQTLVATTPFDEINTPAYEGGNIDHDVAALMGALIVRDSTRPITHFEFPLYHRFDGRVRVGEFLPNAEVEVQFTALSAADHRLLREATRMYRSQRLLLMLLRRKIDRHVQREHGEPYRLAPAYDFFARPAGEQPCRYEVVRKHRSPFIRWLDAVEAFLSVEKDPHALSADVVELVDDLNDDSVAVR